jgi:hypothetical protein
MARFCYAGCSKSWRPRALFLIATDHRCVVVCALQSERDRLAAELAELEQRDTMLRYEVIIQCKLKYT